MSPQQPISRVTPRLRSGEQKVPARTFGADAPTRTGGPGISGPGRSHGPDQILHGAHLAACWRRGPRTQRKPMFWFLFSGWFLFRFAQRRFLGSFQKAPPRSSVFEGQTSFGPDTHSLSANCRADATGNYDYPVRNARSQPPSWRPMSSARSMAWANRSSSR